MSYGGVPGLNYWDLHKMPFEEINEMLEMMEAQKKAEAEAIEKAKAKGKSAGYKSELGG